MTKYLSRYIRSPHFISFMITELLYRLFIASKHMFSQRTIFSKMRSILHVKKLSSAKNYHHLRQLEWLSRVLTASQNVEVLIIVTVPGCKIHVWLTIIIYSRTQRQAEYELMHTVYLAILCTGNFYKVATFKEGTN